MCRPSLWRVSRACVSLCLAIALDLPSGNARADAAVPPRIPLQGFLTNSAGTPISGSVQVTLALYDVATGGAPLYSEVQTVNAVNGVFNAMLGDLTPLNPALFKQLPVYYVGITLDGDALTPRLRFGSVPYAAHAADGVPSGAVMSFELAACPPGWTELTSARGRTIVGLPVGGTLGAAVGSPYTNLEQRTHAHGGSTGSDPGHTHTLDAAAFTSGSTSVAHTHPIDPPLLTTSSEEHAHIWSSWANGGSTSWFTYNSAGDITTLINWTDGMDTAGGGSFPIAKSAPIYEVLYTNRVVHSHTANVASFTSGAASATAHTHSIDPPSAATASSGGHSHAVTTTAATAFAPYVQLLTCRKD